MNLELSLPHKYSPRSYQVGIFKAYQEGYRRLVLVWHRRSGKDKTMLNFMICRMLERVGMYWYILPTYEQARLIIWEGMGSGIHEGMPFLAHFPEELIEYKNEQRLEIGLVNGSIFRLIGSDHVDRIVGANPVGCVFSEYSLQSPSAWEFVSPMLTENKGWASFIYTPRGRNHAYTLYEKAVENKSWFTSLKTIEETRRDSEEELDYYNCVSEQAPPVVNDEDIEEERSRGMDESLVQQEYHCSFVGFREGSYYGEDMATAFREGRIGNVPWDPKRMVFTVWDLGISDQMAIWFAQIEERGIYCIDYYQENQKSLGYFIKIVKDKPYIYSNHWAPHDIEQKELTSGRTRLEIARELGLHFRVVPRMLIMDGINSVRTLLPRCYFDKDKCDQGIRALINYHKEFNKKTNDYRLQPVHDIWSHGADAFRYLSIVADKEIATQLYLKPVAYEKDFDIFNNKDQSQFNIYDPVKYVQ